MIATESTRVRREPLSTPVGREPLSTPVGSETLSAGVGSETLSAGVGSETFGPSKIRAHHRDRLAVVYVRQSSPQQVLEHRESTALQYALRHRAIDWDWPRERVLVIDEDQGCSGASAEGRAGFQRLLAEVSLDHVGLILGIEMSRLARSCKDWHQLLELCAVFGTLLADQRRAVRSTRVQ